MGQIAQDAWIGGWVGGQPNLGNACILGKNGPETLRGVACVYHVYNVYHVYINMLVYISRVSV